MTRSAGIRDELLPVGSRMKLDTSWSVSRLIVQARDEDTLTIWAEADCGSYCEISFGKEQARKFIQNLTKHYKKLWPD